ncbi:EAL domain-containing protein [Paenibacillus sp. UNC499MF]|uniref:sensor domain-containing protein n=1 Tax=Paenibacillus sp. UNC499MF TaxID=1502751 RepID=UPI0008A021BF|nr:EAL domain-containing protein [Paenibacillus sp. UNC499MF]SEG62879.1 PAS domain S-box-containing protein/diguanylate cyclase (GGDEF) domain-containing protein [Paenibacillus sp. UNC499MF]
MRQLRSSPVYRHIMRNGKAYLLTLLVLTIVNNLFSVGQDHMIKVFVFLTTILSAVFLRKSVVLQHILASIAYITLFTLLHNIDYFKLPSIMYTLLLLYAFLLPGLWVPTIVGAGFLLFLLTYSSTVQFDYLRANLVGVVFNTVVYAALSYFFRQMIIERDRLKESENRYRSLIEICPEPIVVQQKGKLVYANPAAVQSLGAEDVNKLLGRSALRFLHPESRKNALEHVNEVLEKGVSARMEQRYVRLDGQVRSCELVLVATNYGGKPACMSIGKDITERKKAEEKINHMAYHDTLTGLPNRSYLNECLYMAIERAGQTGSQLAVLFLDLDRFKNINDTVGHIYGDLLLRQVAERLQACLGPSDTVFRHSGDEFVILLEGVTEDGVCVQAQAVLDQFKQPFQLHGHEVYTTTSIGISIYPQDGMDRDVLIKHADMAMYLSKENGKNNYQFYRVHNNRLARKLKLENGLRRALEKQLFTLHYQPQINLASGEIVGMEALIRWMDPELGVVTPGEFIPIAEETGLIVPIGKWVLHTACYQYKQWREAGLPEIRLAVNISVRQFKDKQLVSTIQSVLEEFDMDPGHLELEITESIMQNLDQSLVILTALKKIGVKISIDDFGTGYSSLFLLDKLPIDHIKIDRTFIEEITFNANTEAIVRTIIDMGRHLNFQLIGEGIEHERQIHFLQEHQCTIGQGFFISPPLSSEKAGELLSRRQPFVQV